MKKLPRCPIIGTHFSLLALTMALATPATSFAADSLEASDALEEIVVTSQRREASIQDVPVSITAIGGEELKRVGAFDFVDFAMRIPNLAVGVKGGGGSGRASSRNVVIRGVGGANTTAYYIDEMPLPERVELKTIDVARIEVLRGPQGTLFGASSMGGAVRVITNQPDTAEFAGDLKLTAATVSEGDQDYRLEGMLNLPLADNTAALRIVGFYDDRSGVYDRLVGDPANPQLVENVDSETTYGAHVSLLFDVNDRLSFLPKIIYQKTESDGYPWADISPDNFQQQRALGLDEPYDDELLNGSLTINYEFASAELVSSTSWFRREYFETEDFTDFAQLAFGFTDPFPAPIISDTTYTKFVQELRLVSDLDGDWQFIGGVFYSDSDTDAIRETITPGFDAFAADQFGAPPGTPIFGTDNVFSFSGLNSTTELALFGEATYQIDDKWSATLGLRWYDAEQTDNNVLDGIVNGGLSTPQGAQEETGTNPKLSIEYRRTEELLFYASAAQGFRLGGANVAADGINNFCQAELAALGLTEAPGGFDSDSIWTYELGMKSDLNDGRLRVNTAIFFSKWDDLQQRIPLACGFAFTDNVGAAETKGAEIEVTARPMDNLDLSLGVGYVDATITAVGDSVNASVGDRIQQVPEFTYNASASYAWDLALDRSIFLRGDLQGATEAFTTFDQTDPLRRRAPYTVGNIWLGLTSDTWEVVGFVKNVTDEHVNFSDSVSTAAEMPGRPRLATNRPRTVGVEVRFRY